SFSTPTPPHPPSPHFPYTTLFRSPASQDSHDRRVGELALGTGQRLRHGAVPSQLGLDEALEFGLLHGFSQRGLVGLGRRRRLRADRKSTRLNSSHVKISYAVFCLK